MSVSQKKGAISAYPELILIIFALALGAVLFTMADKYTGSVKNNFVDEKLNGTVEFVSETLARLAEDCWRLNKNGNAPESDVCFTLNVSATADFKESDFNKYLGCDVLPNNYFNMETPADNSCGGQDKVFWALSNKNTEVTIKYNAKERRIELLELSDACVGSCCTAKCTDKCNGLKADCEDAHSECSGPLCDDFYDQCILTADDICALCADNC